MIETTEFRAGPQVVAVVERDRAPLLERRHRVDVGGHGCVGPPHVGVGIFDTQPRRIRDREPRGHVPAEGIVGARLIGDDVGLPAAAHELGQDLRAVAEQPDRHGRPRGLGLLDPSQRGAEVVGLPVEVARLDPALDPERVDLHAQRDPVVHRHGERLGAAHAAEAAGERDRAGERAPEVLVRALRERLVGALEDALRPDVDPGARRHLPVHREALSLERTERVPVRPLGDEHRVGDQDARRHVVGPEDGHGLARLHEQGLVVLQVTKGAHDGVEGFPGTRGTPGPAVDDEILGPLGHVRVEVVHQHPHRGLLRPRAAGQSAPARCADLPNAHLCHLPPARNGQSGCYPPRRDGTRPGA